MLQGQELFVILLVALVVLGPRRLPEMARKLGSWTAELRRAARDIRTGLEAELSEVKEISDEFQAPVKEIKQSLRDTGKLADETAASTRWIGPKPVSGPTPEDAMADLTRIEETGGPVTDEPETAGVPEPRETGRWVGPEPASGTDEANDTDEPASGAGG